MNNTPVRAPYHLLKFLVGGAVSGSVNIIEAKKKSGDWRSNWVSSIESGFPWTRLKRQVLTSAAAQKSKTISSWRNFLAINHPPIRTTGNMLAVPIHQLAVPSIANAVMTTAIAAGLKRCFFRKARRYFEDIARIATQPRNCKSPGDWAGSSISAKMRAVITADSRLVGIFKTKAKMVFVAQQMTTRKMVESRSERGEKCSRCKNARR